MQRVALTLCLGKPADVYLIDEPSSYLDSEQRLMVSRVIRRSDSAPPPAHPRLPDSSCHQFCCCRFVLHAKKTAFVVEHDLSMVKDLADRVIVFEGAPSRRASANA